MEKEAIFPCCKCSGTNLFIEIKVTKGKIVYKQILKTEVPANVNNVDVFYFIEELQQSEARLPPMNKNLCLYFGKVPKHDVISIGISD